MKIYTLGFFLIFSFVTGSGQNLSGWDSLSHSSSRDSMLVKPGAPDDTKDLSKNAAVRINSIIASPNPANSDLTFNYSMTPGSEGEIIILQITGVVASEIPVTGTHGNIVTDTRDMKEGLYFYYLMVDGKAYSAKKFVIRH
jgi:hypothetical protein